MPIAVSHVVEMSTGVQTEILPIGNFQPKYDISAGNVPALEYGVVRDPRNSSKKGCFERFENPGALTGQRRTQNGGQAGEEDGN